VGIKIISCSVLDFYCNWQSTEIQMRSKKSSFLPSSISKTGVNTYTKTGVDTYSNAAKNPSKSI